jgi:hypothetical protein
MFVTIMRTARLSDLRRRHLTAGFVPQLGVGSFLRSDSAGRTIVTIERPSSERQVNEQALQEDERRAGDLFVAFERRLQAITALGLGLGLVLAALTITYTLRLEKTADERYHESLRIQNELKELSARLVTRRAVLGESRHEYDYRLDTA